MCVCLCVRGCGYVSAYAHVCVRARVCAGLDLRQSVELRGGDGKGAEAVPGAPLKRTGRAEYTHLLESGVYMCVSLSVSLASLYFCACMHAGVCARTRVRSRARMCVFVRACERACVRHV